MRNAGLLFGFLSIACAGLLVVGIINLWISNRLDMKRNKSGKWCEHLNVRCVHGDEIRMANYNRGFCLDCRKYLKQLPETCFVSGTAHTGYFNIEAEACPPVSG